MLYSLNLTFGDSDGSTEMTISNLGFETIIGMVSDLLHGDGYHHGRRIIRIGIADSDHESFSDPWPGIHADNVPVVKMRRWAPPDNSSGRGQVYDNAFEGFGSSSIIGYISDHLDGDDDRLTAGVFQCAVVLLPR